VRIAGDRDHLEQVLNNLIANAVKYTPDGGEITVRVGDEGGQAAISVRDTGIGIPPEELDAVFGLFYRSPDRRARDVGGMGLGLYISKEIVDRHGGRIWAESELGKGTTFQVRLPRSPAFGSSAQTDAA
jgi:signal transduction histidine kinase